MERLVKLTVKIKIVLLFLLITPIIVLTGCKDIIEKEYTFASESNDLINFKEVVFNKNFKINQEVSELNIKYKNNTFKFRFIEDITLLQYTVDNVIVADWQQILFNFEYLTESFDGVRLLFNDVNKEGLLLLPGYTEEYPNLIVYNFESNNISYLFNLDIKSDDLNVIQFKNINSEWEKGSFSAVKYNSNYTVSFLNKSNDKKLNFDKSDYNVLLKPNELKSYKDKVLSYEKQNDANYDVFEKTISAEGLKIIFEKYQDINLDGIEDKIFVFKNNSEFESDKEETKKSKIVIFLSDGSSFKKNINATIFPNDANDQFETIDVKDNYFTIKLFNEVPNECYIEKYITFKIVENIIKLNKFSKVINEKQTNIDVSKIDEILFENYNSNNDLFK